MIENQWYAVLPSKAIRADRPIGAKRLGKNLVFFRNSKGEVAALEDKCTHRGAALSGGKIKGDCVSCPFHAIEFDKNGECRFIPANGKSSMEDISRFNVKSYKVKEAHDIVYLWYGEAEVEDQILPFFNDEIDESFVYSELEDHWNSGYSRCIENQLDVIHVPIVHHNTIGRGNKTLINGPKVIFEDGNIITSANNEKDEGQIPKKPEECTIKETYLKFKFPNIWLNHITDKIKVLIYFAPVDEENTVMYIRFYCKLTKMKLVNKIIAFIGKYANKVVERQDKVVVETQEPKVSALKSGEKLLIGDGPVILYRRIREELKKKSIEKNNIGR